jgi:hypothetical protein
MGGSLLRWLEIIVGVYYLTFGIDGFLKRIPLPLPSERGLKFLIAVQDAKYILLTVKLIEILVGLAWVFGFGSGLAWIALTPIWFNILAYHLYVNKKEKVLPVWLILSHLGLAFKNWDYLWLVLRSAFSI